MGVGTCRVIAARKDNIVGTHIGWGPHDCTVTTTQPLKVSASECVRANGYRSSGVKVSRLTSGACVTHVTLLVKGVFVGCSVGSSACLVKFPV